MIVKTMIGVCMLSLSGAAFALCPDNLNAEQMTECIMIEGAGDISYQQWQQDLRDAEKQRKTAPMVSTVEKNDTRENSSTSEN